MMGNGFGGGYGMGGIGMLVILIIIVVTIVLVAKALWKSEPRTDPQSPLRILKERYARGEITAEQYDEIKRRIEQ